MVIKGLLTVANSTWSVVYKTIINWFNNQVESAYTHALSFYEENKSQNFNLLNSAFEEYILEHKLSEWQISFMRSSLFSGTNQRLYKPKKSNFSKFTNRTETINSGLFDISFNKKEGSIEFTTTSFNDLDEFIANNEFISEFINMVNTIDWPTRPGPNKTQRGCTLTCIDKDSNSIFYKVGPNPPLLNIECKDDTLEEPAFLNATYVKNISLVSFKEEDTQPVPVITEELEF